MDPPTPSVKSKFQTKSQFFFPFCFELYRFFIHIDYLQERVLKVQNNFNMPFLCIITINTLPRAREFL